MNGPYFDFIDGRRIEGDREDHPRVVKSHTSSLVFHIPQDPSKRPHIVTPFHNPHILHPMEEIRREEAAQKAKKMNTDTLCDIIILVHDQHGWADLCIRAVEHHTKNPFRLVIVDSASKDPRTHAVLNAAEDRGHTVVRLAENRSFSEGINAGVAVGRSPYIIVLNDDAIVTEGWDSALLQDASNKTTGLVGARSNYAAGAQGDPSYQGEPPFLVFVCVAMRRQIWDTVGPLDAETFDGFGSEDLDYSWRVKKAGYSLKVSSAFVMHAGSRTLLATTGNTQEALNRNNVRLNEKLIQKWGKEHVAEKTKMQQLGLVVTYSAEEWTRVKFMGALNSLRRSDGVGFHFHNMTRAPIHIARQLACDYATDNGYDWLVQLDDDAMFPNDVIKRLLSHRKEMVSAVAYQRKPPYNTCVFDIGEDGLLGAHKEGIEHTGLRKVDVSGLHVSLMRTSVIKKLRAAGIRQYFGGFENKLGEDFAFGINLKKHGIPFHVDTDLIVGHYGESVCIDENYKALFKAGKAP